MCNPWLACSCRALINAPPHAARLQAHPLRRPCLFHNISWFPLLALPFRSAACSFRPLRVQLQVGWLSHASREQTTESGQWVLLLLPLVPLVTRSEGAAALSDSLGIHGSCRLPYRQTSVSVVFVVTVRGQILQHPISRPPFRIPA